MLSETLLQIFCLNGVSAIIALSSIKYGRSVLIYLLVNSSFIKANALEAIWSPSLELPCKVSIHMGPVKAIIAIGSSFLGLTIDNKVTLLDLLLVSLNVLNTPSILYAFTFWCIVLL